MVRRAADGGAKSRAWRMAAVAVAAATTLLSAGAVAHADEPAVPDSTVPDNTVPTGEFNGAEVAVDVPPVPPTSVEVAVDVPPVPPTSVEVAVDVPPVPPTSVEVAVDVPPVPPVTIPDAAPIVASEAPVPAAVPQHRADEQPEAGPQLPETGAAAARATAIVAGAAVSIGAALKALANRA